MTDLTDETVKSLLDEAYPGPYEIEGRAGQLELMDAKGHIFGCVEWSLGIGATDSATANLLIAAPDLARALLQARADAAAAQALLIERAAEVPGQMATEADAVLTSEGPNKGVEILRDTAVALRDAIRSLAPDAGTAELAKLRQNAEATNGVWQANLRLITERDTLAASLAAQTALVATLTGAAQRMLQHLYDHVPGLGDLDELAAALEAAAKEQGK